jgi:hypothetical protein
MKTQHRIMRESEPPKPQDQNPVVDDGTPHKETPSHLHIFSSLNIHTINHPALVELQAKGGPHLLVEVCVNGTCFVGACRQGDFQYEN